MGETKGLSFLETSCACALGRNERPSHSIGGEGRRGRKSSFLLWQQYPACDAQELPGLPGTVVAEYKMKTAIMAASVALLAASTASAQVDIGLEFVEVGDPGNPPDPFTGDQFGAVAYAYRIGKFEVTNAQYVAFLNDVDPLGANLLTLFHYAMEVSPSGGITLDLARPFGSKYGMKPGKEQWPVILVSGDGARRFVNWLHGGDTEDGAYSLPVSRTRAESAQFWLPDRNEWYKAAYYRGPDSDIRPVYGTDYSLYPMGGFTANSNPPPGDGDSASFYPNGFWDVGSYSSAASHYGTFDQGGHVKEILEDGRITGGDASSSFITLQSSFPPELEPLDPLDNPAGFRIAARIAQPPPLVPDIDICAAVEIKWTTQGGVSYQVQSSGDGQSWFNVGEPIPGTGNPMSSLQEIVGERKLFRVRVVE